MEHLIANSGIHFIITEKELNPEEPLILASNRPLKYTFVETIDFLNGGETSLDVCCFHTKDSVYVPIGYLKKTNQLKAFPNGRDELDEVGVGKMDENTSTALVECYPNSEPCLININSLCSYRVKDPRDAHNIVPAFELLLGTWLPMPMFEKEIDGVSSKYPFGWCRVKIDKLGVGCQKGTYKYRFIWAFDTKTADDILSSFLRPYIQEEEGDSKVYSICNRVDNLFDFLSISHKENESAISDYIVSKLGLDLKSIQNQKYKYIGFYIYLINFLRLSGVAPEVILHNKKDKDVDVDLVLDIGNSRTCGVLFEKGDFTKARMLQIRDLTDPYRVYDNSFDMRVVFRKADFGNDLILDSNLFNWRSLVRVGEEAKRLVYRSLEDDGLVERTTNYSSPKRYLWDKKAYSGRWEFLTSQEDPTNVKIDEGIYIENFTDRFDDNGKFLPTAKEKTLEDLGRGDACHYSRSSLMTFVMIEVLQQAMVYINSCSFRNHHGNIDCRRRLRNVIITCPTAMPIEEQITLRQSAVDAYSLLKDLDNTLPPIKVTPSPEALKITDDNIWGNRGWSYDEAFASQLVYLYAEIAQRYGGENHKFIEMKGHIRPELQAEGYDKKAITIGSIDIGAGTTDVMICSYTYDGEGKSRLMPMPLFWDSFYLAGDDILKNIILNQIIDGSGHGVPDLGSIRSALMCRMLKLNNEQLQQHASLNLHPVYRSKMDNILNNSVDAEEREEQIRSYASNLIHDFFGVDSAMMSYRDRRCRNDFNTQVSLPIAQFMLDLLVKKRPSKVYSFDEIFLENKPSNYLMEHFFEHFGFRFEELSWRFDINEIAAQVRATMEPLMKQLSIVLHAYQCDILVLSGRPTSIDAITELFIKYYPLTPDRLIRLNQYMVGNWYPLADGQGYFYDQKSVVAVGAMVGYLASTSGFHGMDLDFSQVVKNMKSTAKYLGNYNSRRQQVENAYLTPTASTVTLDIPVFPAFIGCKQFDAPIYQARPLFAIYNYSDKSSLRIMLQRNYVQNREEIEVSDVMDNQGNTLPLTAVELVQQSLVDDGKYWLDKGEFDLSLN